MGQQMNILISSFSSFIPPTFLFLLGTKKCHGGMGKKKEIILSCFFFIYKNI